MPLPLTPLGQASSWGSLLRAYELWALDDDEIRRLFCAVLMKELPKGLDARPALAHPLYATVRGMAPGQIEILDDMMKEQAPHQRTQITQMRAFWADTLPAALDLPFSGPEALVARNLRELEAIATAHVDS